MKLNIALVAAAAALILAGVAGASKDSRTSVGVSQSKLGRILVDGRGHTLYLFGKDKRGKSSCSGACATYWPPLIASGKAVAKPGVRASLLGRTKRSDGRWQVTYKRHPLYTFALDTKKGQTKGEGLDDFGGEWDAVSPSGAKIAKESSAPASGGYPPYPFASYRSAPAPLKASVISPRPGASAGAGGTFTVDVSLQARAAKSNGLLSHYTSAFNDPHAASSHPGPNAAAPGLVVLLSTTPTVDGAVVERRTTRPGAAAFGPGWKVAACGSLNADV